MGSCSGKSGAACVTLKRGSRNNSKITHLAKCDGMACPSVRLKFQRLSAKLNPNTHIPGDSAAAANTAIQAATYSTRGSNLLPSSPENIDPAKM